MTSKAGIFIAVSICAAVVLAGSVSFADTMTIKADLKGAAETPPTTAKGAGTLDGTYDSTSKRLAWTVTYSGLTGPATAAHFHAPAPVGKAAGVEIPIKGDLASPITGFTTLTDEQAKNLTDGMTYFNIHTAENKGGELRGQVSTTK